MLAVWEGSSHVQLALLRPLTNAAFSIACQNASAENHLNLEPLFKAWREAMRQVQPFAKIAFDLTLPPLLFTVQWDEELQYNGAQRMLSASKLAGIVVNIATVNGLRHSGDVEFELAPNDEAQNPLPKESLLALRRSLEGLNVHFSSKLPDV